MPTDDERSWVAKLLRSGDVFHADHFPHFPSYAINASVCGCLLAGVSEHAVRFAASYLADMVDPEPERTCRLVPMAWNGAPPYRGTGVVLDALTMGCSECGYPIMARFRKVPNYCPNCGAKVVGDD